MASAVSIVLYVHVHDCMYILIIQEDFDIAHTHD